MSDPSPTEDRFEVETLKPDGETSFDSTTDQTNHLPAKYMTNHALLLGVSYGSIVGSVHVHWKYIALLDVDNLQSKTECVEVVI